MKSVRLSRAFGTPPATVRERVERALKTPEPVSPQKAEAGEALLRGSVQRAARARRCACLVLLALTLALLAATAILLIESDRRGERVDATGAADMQGEALGVQLQVSALTLDNQEARATVVFSCAEGCALNYFWYDGQTLPERFPATGEAARYVFCALRWTQDGAVNGSDLASAQRDGKGQLRVLLSGDWQSGSDAHSLRCEATVVRVDAEGGYAPEDVASLSLPLTVIEE